MSVLAAASEASAIGYSVVFGGVLLGSIVPVVPTGAVVGAAAAFAMTTDSAGLPLVIAIAAVAALLGDLTTFALCRSGGPAAVRWLSRGRHAERIDDLRGQFRRHGWQIVVIGRLLPAGRIPVLATAGALAHPWSRLIPASILGCSLWALAYASLGVLSGGVFDSPLLATLIATVLVLVVGAALNLASARRRRSREAAPEPAPTESRGTA